MTQGATARQLTISKLVLSGVKPTLGGFLMYGNMYYSSVCPSWHLIDTRELYTGSWDHLQLSDVTIEDALESLPKI